MMNCSRFSLIVAIGICLVAPLSRTALAQDPRGSGDSTAESRSNHLQLKLIRETTEGRFRAELRNAGDEALVLNLGMMLANGRMQYADRIHLLLTASDGKQLHLDRLDPPTINGRVDPMVVPLPPGAAMTLPIDLRNYIAPQENVWDLALTAGRYSLSAAYKGEGVSQRSANLDMKGIALMPFWTGDAVSPALRFTLTQKMGRRPTP